MSRVRKGPWIRPNRKSEATRLIWARPPCPRCGSPASKVYGKKGRVRYHRCGCDHRYTSYEPSPEELAAMMR